MRIKETATSALIAIILASLILHVQSCESTEYSNNGSCFSCPINCQSCTAIEGKCTKCSEGYEIDAKQLKLECVPSPPLSDAWKMILLLLGMVLIFIVVALISACYYLRKKRIAHMPQQAEKVVDPMTIVRNQQFMESPPLSFDPSKDECTVCLSDSTNLLTSCGHRFHLECLQEWALVSSSCPNCNTIGIVVKYLCGGCACYSLKLTMCSKVCMGIRHLECARKSIEKGSPCVNCNRPATMEATSLVLQQ